MEEKVTMEISLCTQIKDRNKFLRQCYPTWVSSLFSEIVIVDSPGEENAWDVIKDVASENTRYIKIIEDIPFNLSKFKNACIRACKCETIWYVDSDNFFVSLPETLDVPDRTFFQGTTKGFLGYVVGSFIIMKKDWWSVGGFNERIVGYGGEDGDLYTRLLKSGIKRIPMLEGVGHIDHEDSLRFKFFEEKDKNLSYLKNHIKIKSHSWAKSDKQCTFSVEERSKVNSLIEYDL